MQFKFKASKISTLKKFMDILKAFHKPDEMPKLILFKPDGIEIALKDAGYNYNCRLRLNKTFFDEIDCDKEYIYYFCFTDLYGALINKHHEDVYITTFESKFKIFSVKPIDSEKIKQTKGTSNIFPMRIPTDDQEINIQGINDNFKMQYDIKLNVNKNAFTEIFENGITALGKDLYRMVIESEIHDDLKLMRFTFSNKEKHKSSESILSTEDEDIKVLKFSKIKSVYDVNHLGEFIKLNKTLDTGMLSIKKEDLMCMYYISNDSEISVDLYTMAVYDDDYE